MNKILMVEAEKEMVHEVSKRFSNPNYEIFPAFDGIQGFELAKDKLPDLIITDAVIPLMSGFEFCKAIKLHHDTQSIPIVVLTQNHRMEDSFMYLGIKDFVEKPVVWDNLEKVVKKRLTLSQSMQMLKTKVLINGRPEVLTCCQELFKTTPHWTEYYSYDYNTFLRDALKYAPDVILIDLLLPGIPAEELIKKLKMIPELKNTVILTYYTSTSVSRDPFAIQAQIIEVQYMKRVTQEAGAREYIGPFNPVTFLNIIDAFRRQFNFII